MTLRISEIFLSLQGESLTAGFPTIFIRLGGCNLNCRHCDTGYARENGTPMIPEEICRTVNTFLPVRLVTVTGGEPLMQKGIIPLMERLMDEGFKLQVETNGSYPIDIVPVGVRRIMDIKSPSSGEEGSFLPENIPLLTRNDEVKILIADEKDYLFARSTMEKYLMDSPATVNLSPVYGTIPYLDLARWMIRDRTRAKFHIQLHRVIGLDGEIEKRGGNET